MWARGDKITYNAATGACEKGSTWGKASQLFSAMAQQEVELDTITFGAAISACETCCTLPCTRCVGKEQEEPGPRGAWALGVLGGSLFSGDP